MSLLITWIFSQFGIALPLAGQIFLAPGFSILVGLTAFRGVTGSTNVNVAMSILQLTALVGFRILALAFRLTNSLGVA